MFGGRNDPGTRSKCSNLGSNVMMSLVIATSFSVMVGE